MSDETKAVRGATVAPLRTKVVVSAELDAAKRRLHELQPLVEAEAARLRRFRGRLEQSQNRWRVEHPDEPFDPDAFQPPMRWVPAPDSDAVQREFHALHYTIEELEAELRAFSGPRPDPKP